MVLVIRALFGGKSQKSAEPTDSNTVKYKNTPNQCMEATPLARTPAADAPVAPPSGAAGR